MAGPLTVIKYPLQQLYRALPRAVWVACALLILTPLAHSQPGELERQLDSLAAEREMLTGELDQYKATVSLLQTDGAPPEQSSNPAVRKLALEMVRIRERLVAVTEREVTLLQEQITAARQLAEAAEDQTHASTGM